MNSRETLQFYAGVVLGDGWPHQARKDRVCEVLQAVGLSHAANTLVRQAAAAITKYCHMRQPSTKFLLQAQGRCCPRVKAMCRC